MRPSLLSKKYFICVSRYEESLATTLDYWTSSDKLVQDSHVTADQAKQAIQEIYKDHGLKHLYKAGVCIALGTDATGVEHSRMIHNDNIEIGVPNLF
jgi:hypothetical protein